MMRTHIVLAGLLIVAVSSASAADPESQARSWQKQANDTRTAVVGVAEELEQIADPENADAAGLVADAKSFLAQGDERRAQGEAAMAAGDFETASEEFNMSWQYYVKAATAGLNAKRLLTGR